MRPEPENAVVSVVIPVYNAERYIRGALHSVLAQTHARLDIVVVDDGSRDASVRIIEEFSSRVRLIPQSNHGAAAARNAGVRAATGEWIAFVDADDSWLPDKIERQLRSIRDRAWSHTDAVFVGGPNDGKRHSDFGGKYEGDVLTRLVLNNFISASTVIVRRDVFVAAGGFDERLRLIHDWDLWARIAKEHRLSYLDAPLVRYRVHADSISRSPRETLPEHLTVIAKIFGPDGPGEHLRPLRRVAMANSHGICSQIASEEGDLSFGLRCAVAATVFDPLVLSRWRRLLGCTARAATDLIASRRPALLT